MVAMWKCRACHYPRNFLHYDYCASCGAIKPIVNEHTAQFAFDEFQQYDPNEDTFALRLMYIFMIVSFIIGCMLGAWWKLH